MAEAGVNIPGRDVPLAAPEEFLFIAVEKVAPFACAIHKLRRTVVVEGEALVADAMARYIEVQEHNRARAEQVPPLPPEYPGYPTGHNLTDIPHWAYRFTDPRKTLVRRG